MAPSRRSSDWFATTIRAARLVPRLRGLRAAGRPGLKRIVDEVGQAWPDTRVGVHHRTGRLEIGEASIIIVAASPHRAHAFAACRYTIERVKQIVPIWKHEHFDGGDVWLEGATADPDDEAARQAAYRIACA